MNNQRASCSDGHDVCYVSSYWLSKYCSASYQDIHFSHVLWLSAHIHTSDFLYIYIYIYFESLPLGSVLFPWLQYLSVLVFLSVFLNSFLRSVYKLWAREAKQEEKMPGIFLFTEGLQIDYSSAAWRMKFLWRAKATDDSRTFSCGSRVVELR